MGKVDNILSAYGCTKCNDDDCSKCLYGYGIHRITSGFDYWSCDVGAVEHDAITFLYKLWSDVKQTKSCLICKYNNVCDPNGDGPEFQIWASCGGSMKKNWKWRGLDGE